MTDAEDVCPECSRQDDEDICDACGGEFDDWYISYTTYQCTTCGSVYQDEYRVCKQCYENKTTLTQ